MDETRIEDFGEREVLKARAREDTLRRAGHDVRPPFALNNELGELIGWRLVWRPSPRA
ncbi:hypothetical protein [Rhodoplanes sp. SY1]|uniref:hypothetical protein n=1 Tax=Rhodoplanes sp. SY1 TaxID=3166646 RepID=UPI0038B45174